MKFNLNETSGSEGTADPVKLLQFLVATFLTELDESVTNGRTTNRPTDHQSVVTNGQGLL